MIEWPYESLEMISLETGKSIEEAEDALDEATAKYGYLTEEEIEEDYENFGLIWDEALRLLGK